MQKKILLGDKFTLMTKYGLLLATLGMMLLSAITQAQEPQYYTPEDAN